MTDKEKVPEEIQRLLGTVVDTFTDEDRAVRERQINTWRKLKLYWNSFQHVFYDSVARDWRMPESSSNEQGLDQEYYDKDINVFRAYLESIIAALSVTVPAIKCYPDDAQNSLDLSTAQAGDKIAELVYKHNDVILLWLHALYIYCTEGMIACYSYPKEDEAYGTYEIPEYKTVEETNYTCPTCGAPLDAELFTKREVDKFSPNDEDAELRSAINEGMIVCPVCSAFIDPDVEPNSQMVQKLVGVTRHPKSRQCIEVYGGLYVKVANWAMKQADTPYLIFSYETHYANALERYPELRDKGKGVSKIKSTPGVDDPYEQWGRLSPQYRGEFPIDNVTVRNCWLRPSSFNILPEEDAKKLKDLYPDGAKVVFVNDSFADAENECLDDCWTLTHNPLSDYLYHDPLGMLLVSVQDITNDLVSLVIQTIEHGITEVFVDPQVVNLNQYGQREVAPGNLTAAKAKTGKALGDSFHEVKTSVLSGEVLPFAEMIQSMGQLTTGALPSLFGGAQTEGSKTASQYAMSRAQALQRLQTPWKMLTIWWKTIFGKVIPSYIKEVKEDERFVKRDESGNFINVFIRKAELQGKIGNIELEANENLPITWSQKKDIIMGLLQGGNPIILEGLLAPENLPFIKEAIGLPEFVIPGEQDRQKQYEEIQQLLNSEPLILPGLMDPMTGMMNPEQEVPTVEVDEFLDNHQIEAEICRSWLVGDAGRLAKTENPGGYQNVLLHMKQHMQLMIQAQMVAEMNAQQGAAPSDKQPKQDKPNPSGKNQAAIKAPVGDENATV